MPNYERLHYLEQDIAERRERAIIEFTSSRFYNSKETYHVIDELLLTQPLIDSQLKRDLFYLADEHQTGLITDIMFNELQGIMRLCSKETVKIACPPNPPRHFSQPSQYTLEHYLESITVNQKLTSSLFTLLTSNSSLSERKARNFQQLLQALTNPVLAVDTEVEKLQNKFKSIDSQLVRNLHDLLSPDQEETNFYDVDNLALLLQSLIREPLPTEVQLFDLKSFVTVDKNADGVIQLSELCECYPEIEQKVLLDLYSTLVPEGGGLDERQYEYMKNMIATMLQPDCEPAGSKLSSLQQLSGDDKESFQLLAQATTARVDQSAIPKQLVIENSPPSIQNIVKEICDVGGFESFKTDEAQNLHSLMDLVAE